MWVGSEVEGKIKMNKNVQSETIMIWEDYLGLRPFS